MGRCANQLKPHWAWTRLETAVDRVVSDMLQFSDHLLTDVHHANFERNKATLEFIGQLQAADEMAAVEMEAGHDSAEPKEMTAKPGYAHHEACSEFLQCLWRTQILQQQITLINYQSDRQTSDFVESGKSTSLQFTSHSHIALHLTHHKYLAVLALAYINIGILRRQCNSAIMFSW